MLYLSKYYNSQKRLNHQSQKHSLKYLDLFLLYLLCFHEFISNDKLRQLRRADPLIITIKNMMKAVLRGGARTLLANNNNYNFSNKITEYSRNLIEQRARLMEEYEMMANPANNIMKYYHPILAGVYMRDDLAIEDDMWETRSKRQRHAKLKRSRRKGPRRTVITNN